MKKLFRNKIFIITIFLVIIAAITGVSVWAAFSKSQSYGIKGNYTDISKTETTDNGIILTSDSSNTTAFTFNQSGDTKVYSFTLKNTSTDALGYNFYIDEVSDTEASKMVLVYLDDEFVGTLSNVNEKLYLLSNDIILLPNEEKSISLRYELHNAVESDFYDDGELSFTSTFNTKTSTLDYQEYTLVNSYDELKQIVATINSHSDYHPTILLNDNITLSSEMTLSGAVTIDLHGHSISGSTFIIEANVDFTSDASASVQSNITLNSGYVWFNDQAAQSGTVSFSEDYDTTNVAKKVADELSGKKIESGYNIFENNTFYNNKITVTAASDYTYSDGVITYTGSIDNHTYITIGSNKVNFTILNSSDLSSKINKELEYLDYYNMLDSDYTTNGSQVVTSDLFFPTALKKYNATLTWQSSDPLTLNASGETTKAGTGVVNVVVTIEYNGSSYTRNYKFNVLKQNNEMKFQYLLAKIGTIRFTETWDNTYTTITENTDSDGNHLSWTYSSNSFTWLYGTESTEETEHTTTNCYAKLLEIEHLGIKSITYSLDDTYYYLTFGTNNSMNYLYLNDVTFDNYAGLNISVSFTDEPLIDETTGKAKVYTGVIPVAMKLTDNRQIVDDIMNYASSQFTQVSVLDNMINTRDAYGILNEKGDFTLISDYMGYTIIYENPDESNQYYSIVNAVNYNGRIYYVTDDKVTIGTTAYSVKDGYAAIPAAATITSSTTDGVTTGTLTANNTSIVSTTEEEITINDVTYTYSNGTYTKADDATTYFIFKVDTDYVLVSSDSTSASINLNYQVLQCVKVKPEAFETAEKDIQIIYTVKLNGNVVSSTDGTIYDVPTFAIPAAIHNNTSGFTDATVFTSVKLQVLQENNVDITPYTTYTPTGVGDYILVHDIKNTETIVLRYGTSTSLVTGNNIDDLITGLNWATGSGTAICSLFSSETYSWITSDGNATVSDKEEYALRQYFKPIPYFDALLDTFLYGSNTALIRDNELTQAEADELKAVTQDFAYTQLIAWATATSKSSDPTAQYLLDNVADWNTNLVANYLTITTPVAYNALTLEQDGLETISRDEENVILRYVWSKGYSNFYSVWVQYMTSEDNTLESKTYTDANSKSQTVNELYYVLYEGLALDVFNALVSWAEYAPTDTNVETSGNYDKAYLYGSGTSNGTVTGSNRTSDYGSTTMWEAVSNKINGLTKAVFKGLFGFSDTQLDQKDCWAGVYSKRDWYIYTGNAYTTGNVISDKEIDIFNTFFNSFGLGTEYLTTNSSTYLTTTSYSAEASALGKTTVKLSPVTIFANNGVSSLKTIVQNNATHSTTDSAASKIVYDDLEKLISWAQSTTWGTLSSNISLSSTNSIMIDSIGSHEKVAISDGLTSISYEEYLVIKAYLEKYYVSVGRNTAANNTTFVDNALQFVLNMTFTSKYTTTAATNLTKSLGLNSELFDALVNYSKASGIVTINGTAYPVIDGIVTIGATYTVNSGSITYNGTNYSVVYAPFSITIDSTTYSFDGIPTISTTERGYIAGYASNLSSAIQTSYKAKLDNALKNMSDKAFSDLEEFKSTVQSIYPSVKYLEIKIQINDNELNGFDYFTGLKEIYAEGVSGTALFSTTDAAKNFLKNVTKHSASISKIAMKYAGIVDISTLANLTKITYLDLEGNTITDISVLNNFDNGYLSYLNLWSTSINLASALSVIENIYLKFDSDKYTYIKKSDIRYSAGGENIYFSMSDLSKYRAMSYCYLLKEIDEITWWRMQVPTEICIASGSYVDVNWTVGTSNIEISTYYSANTIHRLSYAEDTAVVYATVTVDGVSYTRTFNVSLSELTVTEDPTKTTTN